MRYIKPILPGFYPDPSVCRAGEDYYLVTSTFEYFPGIPVFHSRDLIHWRQIGHCLSRPSQLPLQNARASQGMYAPTLRFHDGQFYMIARNNTAQQMLIVRTSNPAGEWSDPMWIGAWGGDPSLFFDDDGQSYLTVCGEGAIHQTIIDLCTGTCDGTFRRIWTGTGGLSPEGPHLYKVDDVYYLMIAEGGTHYGHMETIARSHSPWGPFEPCPRNPILTHRSTASSIQGIGHADLIQDHHANWWLVCLGFRPVGHCHYLGRETFLAPVKWESGWPVIGQSGTIATEPQVDTLPVHRWQPASCRDNFDTPDLRHCWNFLRNPQPLDWSLAERPGWLRLTGSAASLDDEESPAFIGRRQQHFVFEAETMLEFDPRFATANREEAGLTVRMDERHHAEIAIALIENKRYLITHLRLGAVAQTELGVILADGPVKLIVIGDQDHYRLSYSVAGSVVQEVACLDCCFLSTEVAGGHTGVYIGMYATGRGRRSVNSAYFDYFDYRGEE